MSNFWGSHHYREGYKCIKIKISDSNYWNEDYNMFYQNGYVYLLVKQTDVIKVFNSATLEAVENAEEGK